MRLTILGQRSPDLPLAVSRSLMGKLRVLVLGSIKPVGKSLAPLLR